VSCLIPQYSVNDGKKKRPVENKPFLPEIISEGY